MRVGSHWRS